MDRNGALTDAQRRALIAVRDGKVERYYNNTGNRFVVDRKHASARAVWALERRGLIIDGKYRDGATMGWARMELSKSGRELLMLDTAHQYAEGWRDERRPVRKP